MDYEAYKSRVASETGRDDQAALIATVINEARKQIADGSLPIPDIGDDRFSWMYQKDEVVTVSGIALYDLPAGFIDEISFFYPADNKPLLKKESWEMDKEYCRGNAYDATGEPAHYVLRGTQYQIYPCPNGVYTYWMRYYAYPTDLAADDSEYTIDTKIPALVISAASLLLAMNLHDAELIDLFGGITQTRYENAARSDTMRQVANNQNLRILTHKDFNTTHFKALRGD